MISTKRRRVRNCYFLKNEISKNNIGPILKLNFIFEKWVSVLSLEPSPEASTKQGRKKGGKDSDLSRENSSTLCQLYSYINHSIRAANPVPRLRFAADLRLGITGSSKALYGIKLSCRLKLFSREREALSKKRR